MRTDGDRVGLALFGKAKRAILATLFGFPDRSFYVRELARAAGVTPSTLTRDLASLTAAGVIARRQDGQQVYYQANAQSPVFSELRGLVTKTFGIVDAVRAMLDPIREHIAVAAVYGSVARNEHRADSDVDLLIVGDVVSSQFASRLADTERALGRRITPTIFPVSEFREKRGKAPFIRAIMKRPMIFVIGDAHELEVIS